HKFARSPQEKEMLRLVGGIGTARTRGTVIEAAIKRGYFARTKRGKTIELRITPDGQKVLAGLPDVAKDVAMTAKWERALGMVSTGDAAPEALKGKVAEMLGNLVPSLLNSAK
ncbi:MAG: hypothetical protein K2W33_03725, partial [Burkholderiales bacterium]|nr:hypothetical protein [Burkholderiales bacterium]